MQGEECLGCQILSQFPSACDAQGKSKHRLDVLVIQLLEGRHREYGQRPRSEDFPKSGGCRPGTERPTIPESQSFVPFALCGPYSPR